MKKNRLIAFALSVSLLLGASACGKPAKTVSELIAEDYKTLTDDAAKVRKLEDQLQELPPEEGTTTSASDTFPAFEGKDLDGNAVDSSVITYFNPMMHTAVFRVYAEELSYVRQHPLTLRRYMWKLEY